MTSILGTDGPVFDESSDTEENYEGMEALGYIVDSALVKLDDVEEAEGDLLAEFFYYGAYAALTLLQSGFTWPDGEYEAFSASELLDQAQDGAADIIDEETMDEEAGDTPDEGYVWK